MIILLPIILVQLLSTYFFLERHWDTVSRRLAISLANDIELLLNLEENNTKAQKILQVRMQPVETNWQNLPSTAKPFGYPALKKELNNRFPYPFYVTNAGEDTLAIYIKKPDQIWLFSANHKRLYSITVYLYVLISTIMAVILATIAVLFSRNQIRPIRSLAKAMIQFGKTNHVVPLKPSGAREIQLAATAFNRMQQRIKNQVEERTFMLAGISHDLRTPIARMKLELAMLPDETAGNFKLDLREMEHLINSYIEFVEAGQHHQKEEISLIDLLEESIQDVPQSNRDKIQLLAKESISVKLDRKATKRCFLNILLNACRYGNKVEVYVQRKKNYCRICFHNDGESIPLTDQEKIFQPFYSADGSHQQGAGLGLAICKDIIERHNGIIYVNNNFRTDGATICIELPLKAYPKTHV